MILLGMLTCSVSVKVVMRDDKCSSETLDDSNGDKSTVRDYDRIGGDFSSAVSVQFWPLNKTLPINLDVLEINDETQVL